MSGASLVSRGRVINRLRVTCHGSRFPNHGPRTTDHEYMPRIIAGRFKGRRLVCPKGTAVRPTADRVKESLFQIIGPSIEEAAVLDLYAGCGSLGLEALSRGARECYFVDRSSICCNAIRKNLEKLRLEESATVMRLDCIRAVRLLDAEGIKFDVVFADPPYGKFERSRNKGRKVLLALDSCGILTSRSLLVIEHFSKDSPRSEFKQLSFKEQRTYGDTALSFFVLNNRSED